MRVGFRCLVAVCASVSVAALPAAAAARPTSILYVGDSLGVGTALRLAPLVPRTRIEADTRVGRTSGEGLAVLRSRLRPGHGVVIFDVGSNDHRAAALARNLRRARSVSGPRLMVVLTLNKPGVRPFNRVVRRFAAASTNVTLIDWYSVARKERLLVSDGVHARSRGYTRRAALLRGELRR